MQSLLCRHGPPICAMHGGWSLGIPPVLYRLIQPADGAKSAQEAAIKVSGTGLFLSGCKPRPHRACHPLVQPMEYHFHTQIWTQWRWMEKVVTLIVTGPNMAFEFSVGCRYNCQCTTLLGRDHWFIIPTEKIQKVSCGPSKFKLFISWEKRPGFAFLRESNEDLNGLFS